MLHPFISSHAVRVDRSGMSGLSVSVVAHASLIAAAMLASATSRSGVLAREAAAVERIVFTRISNIERAAGDASASVAARRRERSAQRAAEARPYAVPDLAVLDGADAIPELPDLAAAALPAIDLQATATEGLEFADPGGGRGLLRAALGRSRLEVVDDGRAAYTADMVELAAEPRLGNPIPRYPYSLQADGIEDEFVVRFVVDSIGRVEARSVSFPKRAHRLFAASVRDALLRSHYFPAQIGGHRVAQLVQQRFSFVLSR